MSKKASGTLISMVSLIRDHLGSTGVELQTAEVFLLVGQEGSIGMSELSAKVGITLASMTRNIDRLGEGGPRANGLGLVRRTPDPADRRLKIIQLSAKGQRVYDKLMAGLGEAMDKYCKD